MNCIQLLRVFPILETNYRVKFDQICIGKIDYTIRSLLNLQQFSDPDGEALKIGISSALWPLFGKVWGMSKILAQVMLTEDIAGKRILEIGCGLALPSLVIKHLGGNITASDYHPLVASFLLENTLLNHLEAIAFQIGNWNLVNANLGKFDLIIGSDVLYEQQHIKLLSGFINNHASSSVTIIIVDPNRGSHRAFAREMERLGYQHSWTDLRDYCQNQIKPKGFILRFNRDRLVCC
ncbi:MAG: class I SAM-dependent methyltransferase [Microcystaceae cyanobacterium]